MSVTELGYAPEEAKERVGFFTDTSICIGCKACEVACKEWNRNPQDSEYELLGSSYDNTGSLGADTWRHVAFIEQDSEQIGQARFLCDFSTGAPRDDGRLDLRQVALEELREANVKRLADHQVQHGVTEELESLVAVVVGGLGHPRAMAHRAAQQLWIVERVTQPLREGVEIHAASSAHPGEHVVDGVADGLQVLEILVLDTKTLRAVGQFLLERLDEFDQCE